MDLYTEKINEFTDWVSGDNSLTNGNDTNNLPVSGARIRELLQEHLKKPVYMWKDTTENLYRIFSSVDSWKIWDSDRTKYSKLELASFTAPSEYGIQVTFPEGGTVIYAREGVHDDNTKISFDWEVVDGKGNEQDENMYVTYSIAENGALIPQTYTSAEKKVVMDLYEYLSIGKNTVKISFKGADSGAEIEKTVIVNVLKLNVSTDFNYAVLQRNLSTLSFSLYADRNIEGPLSFKTKRYYYGSNKFNENVQEQCENTINIRTADQHNLTPGETYRESQSQDIIRLKAGLHSVQVLGKMVVNSKDFYSNLLYYIFGVGYASGTIGDVIHGIGVECNFNGKIDFIGPNEFMLDAQQYEQFTLNWAYLSYISGMSNSVSWYLRDVSQDDAEDVNETFITTVECSSNTVATPLQYMPIESTAEGRNTYLVAKIGDADIIELPIYIRESDLAIGETNTDLKLKLSAYGKTNESSDKETWEYDTYSTTFTNVKWNTANGWYDNSLRLSGKGSSAVINCNPFENIYAYQDGDMIETNGATIEIEFESEYVSSTDEELIRLGDTETNTAPHISIYANKASLFINGSPIITTNYKANERVKLAFIIEPRVNVADYIQNVIFIVNNGICERAAGWKDYGTSAFSSNSGVIKIGDCHSGIRVYNIRCYTKAITIVNAYNNYVYDSDDKRTIVTKNDIYESGEISASKCQNKLDVIILKGPLNNILSRNTTKEGSNSECDFERICPSDRSKNFTVTHGRIRKHGQSTLNYPLTSYKLWTWSSMDDERPTLTLGSKEEARELEFTKNRYQAKTDAIPANKFVLQANYADSSGTHNGGFLRLIQDIWYNSKIDGEYKLRTQPQLFASNQTISVQPGDTNMTRVVNNKTELTAAGRLFCGMNTEGKQWKDYFGETPFPYTIRVAPDSFPCLVFYQNTDTGDTAPHFLGQYVFMDDKKSDYTYGQRSIYKIQGQSGTNNANDPFCVKRDPETGEAIWEEDEGTKIWDNSNVLRIECTSVNSTLSDFRGTIADNSKRRFDHTILGDSDLNTSIGWEEDFELIYPEKEEITSKKVFSASKFVSTVKPFTDWLDWIIGTKGNQAEFEATAAQHLDLYKMAAYYIFVLRFGLVDSLERNAQIKTYDGRHFHYEPWDMDIALGNRNTGGIAFDPPIDRNTMMDASTAAISGKAILDTNNDDIPDTPVSNWLFDALEAWPYWINTIVPKVADAMYKQGLTYNNVINMLDGQYQNAWCETIYNETGNFKYIVNRQNVDSSGNILPGYDDSWLSWLQGARTTHRHWWLKSSMDYYDAKWGIGEFMEKNMYIGCEMHNVQGYIKVMPTASTFFKFQREADSYGPFTANVQQPLQFDVSSINSGAKVPFKMYGANFIKEIDISDIAVGLQMFQIATSYSPEVGPTITKVNIGVRVTKDENDDNLYRGQENNKELQISAGLALNAIEELNIRGQHSAGTHNDKHIMGLDFIANTKTIKKIYAMGAGMETLNTCVGTSFEELELPDTITSIAFNDTTWDHSKLSFWHLESSGYQMVTYEQEMVDDQGNVVYDENDQPVMEQYEVQEMQPATYTKFDLNDNQIGVSIPRGLISVSMTGTTARNMCARQFVGDWIASIIKWGTEDWNNQENGADEYNSLDEYLTHLFNERNLSVENIYWDNTTIPGLSYDQLSWIAKFNNIDYTQQYATHPNVRNFKKGYVVLTNGENLTGIQTSYLSTWFGESVFVLNSNGLVIDQRKNYTTISVGPSAYVENGQIYLKEGEAARIQATSFNLRPSLEQANFALDDPESNGYGSTSYKGASITVKKIGNDYIYYLQTVPYITGEDYDVKLMSGSGSVVVHIKALDYPEEIFLSINGDKKTESSGDDYSFYKYDKGFDVFVLGKLSGQFQVGVQFKEDGRWVNTPASDALTPTSVTFKMYRNDVLCPKFEQPKSYTEFVQTGVIVQNDVDTNNNLAYTTGYQASSDTYKYFIPLYVQGNVADVFNPIKYTVECNIMIGGMIKTLYADLILINDFIVAPYGTRIWGLINKSYVEQKEENYEKSFYRSITELLTGTISVTGQYNDNGTWTTVGSNTPTLIYNNNSILKYLPNITGINLDGSSQLVNTVNDVPNIDLSNITKLQTFSIQRCTGLTGNIDLSAQTDLREVDASGTTVNIILPQNPKVTKYEVGAPTNISLENPTVLTPAGVKVSSYEYLDSLIIKNIPNVKSYTMFAKIMKNVGAEMLDDTWVSNGELTYNTAWRTSTEIYGVSRGDSITTTSNGFVIEYYTNGTNNSYGVTANSTYVINPSNNRTIDYIRYIIDKNIQSATLTNDTTGKILVSYNA